MYYVLLAALVVIGLPIAFLKFGDHFGAALLVLVGIYLLGDTTLKNSDMRALASTGQTATVEPLGDTYTITKKKSGYTTYKARIVFETRSGQSISEETSIPDAVMDNFKRGQKATVTYLPANPKVYRFNPMQSPGSDDFMLSLGIILAGSLWIGFKRLMGGKPVEA